MRAKYRGAPWYKDLHGNYTYMLLPYSETQLRELGRTTLSFSGSTPGDDLYYHCQANCWATNEGKVEAVTAKVISFFRTGVYGRLTEDDWRDDDRANKCGQKGGDCNKLCAPFIPKSSPEKPPFPGW